MEKDRLGALAELLVSPSRWSPVFLIEPVGHLKGDVGCLHNLGYARPFASKLAWLSLEWLFDVRYALIFKRVGAPYIIHLSPAIR